MPPKNPLNRADETPLGPDFKPGRYDVICHRGEDAYHHNRHFRQLIDEHLELYSQCHSRVDKCVLVGALAAVIREERSPNGGFVKFCNRRRCFVEIGDRGSRQKVAHALRNGSMRRKGHSFRWKSEAKADKIGSDDEPPSALKSQEQELSQTILFSQTNLLDMLATEMKDSTRTASWSTPFQFDSMSSAELKGSTGPEKATSKAAAGPPDDAATSPLPFLQSESLLLDICAATLSENNTLKDFDIDALFNSD